MSSPVSRLEKFTPEEKDKIEKHFKRKLFSSGITGGIIILACISCLIFLNVYNENYYFEKNLEVFNVVLVVILVISARLIVSEYLEFRKEIKCPDKKVVEARIIVKKDNKIILGNKAFEGKDFLFEPEDFESLKAGDNVRVELSAKSSRLFSIQKI